MIARQGEVSVPARLSVTLFAGALGAAWWLVDPLATHSFQVDALDLLLFVAAAAVMELLPIRLPDGRAVPTSLAVIGAAAILGASPFAVALVAAAGWTVARLVDKAPFGVAVLLQRAGGGWALAGLASIGSVLGPPLWTGTSTDGVAASLDLGAASVVTFAVLVGVPVFNAMARTTTGWRYLLRRAGESIRANALVGTAVSTTATLGALVHPVLGHWTLPTMLIPLFAARLGLDRLASSARAYDQTLRAMSRLPEQLETVTAGHGVRVATLAGEVALELGLDAGLVADVVRAAHLHELGRIQLEHDEPVSQRELATLGAGLIGESPRLARVAAIVDAHGNLHGIYGDGDDVSIGARIVAACCEIDRYAPDPGVVAQRQEVTVRLVREVGDLEVVAALTRVLDRAGAGMLTGR